MSEVIRLGAWCDYSTVAERRTELQAMGFPPAEVDEELDRLLRQVSLNVSEFAVLADGRRLTLHEKERGYSGGSWRGLTLEGVRADVLTTVLPDDDDGEEHPWEWLSELLRSQGVAVSTDRLRTVPYVVELSDRLRARIANEDGSL